MQAKYKTTFWNAEDALCNVNYFSRITSFCGGRKTFFFRRRRGVLEGDGPAASPTASSSSHGDRGMTGRTAATSMTTSCGSPAGRAARAVGARRMRAGRPSATRAGARVEGGPAAARDGGWGGCMACMVVQARQPSGEVPCRRHAAGSARRGVNQKKKSSATCGRPSQAERERKKKGNGPPPHRPRPRPAHHLEGFRHLPGLVGQCRRCA